jgi:hypothetical protein
LTLMNVNVVFVSRLRPAQEHLYFLLGSRPITDRAADKYLIDFAARGRARGIDTGALLNVAAGTVQTSGPSKSGAGSVWIYGTASRLCARSDERNTAKQPNPGQAKQHREGRSSGGGRRGISFHRVLRRDDRGISRIGRR